MNIDEQTIIDLQTRLVFQEETIETLDKALLRPPEVVCRLTRM